MKYQQLTEGQRYQISVLREDNLSCREIGLRIGVSKSTISRELRRNASDTGYEPHQAQQLSLDRRLSAAKKTICQQTMDFVDFALEWKWSPEQISAVAACHMLSSEIIVDHYIIR